MKKKGRRSIGHGSTEYKGGIEHLAKYHARSSDNHAIPARPHRRLHFAMSKGVLECASKTPIPARTMMVCCSVICLSNRVSFLCLVIASRSILVEVMTKSLNFHMQDTLICTLVTCHKHKRLALMQALQAREPGNSKSLRHETKNGWLHLLDNEHPLYRRKTPLNLFRSTCWR